MHFLVLSTKSAFLVVGIWSCGNYLEGHFGFGFVWAGTFMECLKLQPYEF